MIYVVKIFHGWLNNMNTFLLPLVLADWLVKIEQMGSAQNTPLLRVFPGDFITKFYRIWILPFLLDPELWNNKCLPYKDPRCDHILSLNMNQPNFAIIRIPRECNKCFEGTSRVNQHTPDIQSYHGLFSDVNVHFFTACGCMHLSKPHLPCCSRT